MLIHKMFHQLLYRYIHRFKNAIYQLQQYQAVIKQLLPITTDILFEIKSIKTLTIQ